MYEDIRLYPAVRKDLLRVLPAGLGKVLDVGCGAGALGEELVRQGKADEVYGVDLSPGAVAAASKRLSRAQLVDLDRDPLPFEPATFDTLIYGDVLEHLKFPWITLREHRNLLKRGGRAFCSIPNVGYRVTLFKLLRQRWDYETEGLFDYTHLRFFTRRSLEAMFRDAGFADVACSSLHPPSPKLQLLNIVTFGALRDFNISSFWIEAHA
jgi:2-polyprenyl-3-methyl-5-hydroxy-6-metoxy-1,4-benzoquinol methylase